VNAYYKDQEKKNPHLRDLDGLVSSHDNSDSDYSKKDSSSNNYKDEEEDHVDDNILMTCVGAIVPEKYAKNYGCFLVDKEEAKIMHFYQKSKESYSNIINCGIYYISV
jgi:NDP-sugar pyrophosphorylase family protein